MIIKMLIQGEVEDLNLAINACYKKSLDAKEKFKEQEDTVDKDLSIAVFFYYDNSYSSNAFIDLLDIIRVEANYDFNTDSFNVYKDREYMITSEMIERLEEYYNENSKTLIREVLAYNETEGLVSIRHNMRAIECIDKFIAILEFFNCIGYFVDYKNINKIRQINDDEKKENYEYIKNVYHKRESFREIVIEKLKCFYSYANTLVELEIKKAEIKKLESDQLRVINDDSEIAYLVKKCEDKKREYLMSEAIERKKILEVIKTNIIIDVEESFKKRLEDLPRSIKESI